MTGKITSEKKGLKTGQRKVEKEKQRKKLVKE